MPAIGNNRYNEEWQAKHVEETERMLKEAAENPTWYTAVPSIHQILLGYSEMQNIPAGQFALFAHAVRSSHRKNLPAS